MQSPDCTLKAKSKYWNLKHLDVGWAVFHEDISYVGIMWKLRSSSPSLLVSPRRGSLSLQIPIAITVHFSAAASLPLSQTYQLPSLHRSGRSFPIWRSTRLGWGSTSRPTRPAILTRRRQNLLSDSFICPTGGVDTSPMDKTNKCRLGINWLWIALNCFRLHVHIFLIYLSIMA